MLVAETHNPLRVTNIRRKWAVRFQETRTDLFVRLCPHDGNRMIASSGRLIAAFPEA